MAFDDNLHAWRTRAMRILGAAVLSAGLFYAAPSAAMTYSFYCVTNTNPADCATGESDLSMDVTDPGSDQVTFTFLNDTSNSSITDVYFDDGALLGIASISDSGSGVAFTEMATPGNLPGANNASPPFVTTSGQFSADSDPPVSGNGVNSSTEWLSITFDLQLGKTYQDALDDLGSGVLRVGLHVQAFDGGGSESFVSAVPEPSTALLLGVGIAALCAGRKHRGA